MKNLLQLSFLILLLDLAAYFLTKNSSRPELFFFIAHLLICLFMFMRIRQLWQQKEDKRFLLLLGALTFALGFWGAGITIFATLLCPLYQKTFHALAKVLDGYFPPSEELPSMTLYDRISTLREAQDPDKILVAFQDIMTFGSFKQKRLAIEKMLRYYRPEFASALLMGLNDPSNAIRVQTGTAITALEKRFLSRFLSLEQLSKQHPDDPQFLLEFARHCQEYANLQILETDRASHMRVKAIRAYERYLSLKPENPDILLSLAQLHLENHEPARAKALLNRIVAEQRNPSDKCYLLLMQALYDGKDYEELHATAKQLRSENKHPELNEWISLWSKREIRECLINKRIYAYFSKEAILTSLVESQNGAMI